MHENTFQEVLMQQAEIPLPLPLPSEPQMKAEPNQHPCYRCPTKYLSAYGFKAQKMPRAEILLSFVVVLIIGIGSKLGLDESLFIATFSALGAVVFTYQQWRESRHETSMDKYYERLDIANRKRKEGGKLVYEMMRYPQQGIIAEPQKMLYLYAELDNLEYVIEKYRLGFMPPEQACRGLRTFQQRCRSEEFRNLALARVRHGDYHDDTSRVVETVVAEVEKQLKKLAEPAVECAATPPQGLTPLQKAAAILFVVLSALWLLSFLPVSTP